MKLIDLKTDKDVYDYIVNKLTEQYEKSYMADLDDTCAYRGYKSEDLDRQAMNIFGMEYHELYHHDDKFRCIEKLEFSLKCAVGHIIEDEYYDSSLEESTIVQDNVLNAVIKSLPKWKMNRKSTTMLQKLQSIHDFSFPIYWEKDFAGFIFNEEGEYIDYERSNN